ncbi:unnamed protein product (macronuclear) [Paramecium tetraurelia]|uniref:Cation-transporting ATPase n=1 Tax=Paramecium tetraurelia TaxID=5888 RepID=A0D8W5_PARTE|nr:uncharacterized protein GSPATT00014428001 [Paramecium tetraurelia]CAK79482.1 unnamed protein product [Paramecium tetraurelia]|eukprot:XP_001446879.1 hypothetical protein (macronuclear) [Paramecium tetraurelia strain d4-2]
MIELQETSPKEEIDFGQSTLEYQGEYDDQYKLTAIYYRINKCKQIIYYVLLFLTLGLLYLFQRWFINLRLFLLFEKCEFGTMTHVLVIKTKNIIPIADDQLCEVTVVQDHPFSKHARVFNYELSDYFIDTYSKALVQMRNSFSQYTQERICNMKGLSELTTIYGQNIMEIPIKPIPLLLLDEILTPFNIFQFSALALWAYDDYLNYSLFILAITIIQIGIELRDVRQNLQKIQKMIRFNVDVKVIRNNNQITIESKELIPGDLLIIEGHTKISCDCILIEGNCVMNEAVLTGESVPINKSSLEKNEQLFLQKGNENKMLFCGTTCLRSYSQNGEHAKAIVYQTGFQTLKGSLARSIMFNRTQTFSFYRDSLRYLFVLATLGLIQANITILISGAQGVALGESIINALEIVTIIVPATLPTALGAGISLALKRLEDKSIQCVKPDKINVASKVNLVAFDKTGTLTELGLDVLGCREIKDQGCFQNSLMSVWVFVIHYQQQIMRLWEIQLIYVCFKRLDGSQWKRVRQEKEGKEVSVLKRFDFQAELQRMSVITNQCILYCKGSPEQIKSICRNIPINYNNMLQKYSSQGFRIIACCYRDREIYEQSMSFLGFLIFENKLKAETQSTILSLKYSNIKSIMVTGDNPYTAINIGLQCNILDQNSRIFLGQLNEGVLYWNEINAIENRQNSNQAQNLETNQIMKLSCHLQLAITGQVFEYLQYQYAALLDNQQWVLNLLQKTYIYSRMKPNNKGDLMLLLRQDNLNFIAFCGDGTNDTCALRQADVGLALSLEDASLASPFTSTIFNISNMINLIKEGRACLVTCVECFKFMTLYSCIQSAAVLQCYFYDTDFTQVQYLYQDLWLIIPLAFTMDLTKSYNKLANYRPISNLISLPVLSSVCVIIFISFLAQMIMHQILKHQDFYQQMVIELVNDDYYMQPNYTNSILLITSSTEILAVGLAYTQGPPFREAISQNFYYMIVICMGIAGQIVLIFFPNLTGFLSLEVEFPTDFKIQILVVNIVVGITIVFYEKLITAKMTQKYAEVEINLGNQN